MLGQVTLPWTKLSEGTKEGFKDMPSAGCKAMILVEAELDDKAEGKASKAQ